MKNYFLYLVYVFLIISIKSYSKNNILDDSTRGLIRVSLGKLKNVKTTDEKLNVYLECSKIIGNSENYNQYVDSFYYFSSIAYNLSKKTSNQRLIFASASDFSLINSFIGNYSESINILLYTIERLKNKNDTLVLYLTQKIENIYRKTKDFKSQLKYAFVERELANKLKLNYLGINASIGDSFQNLNMLDSALYYFNKDYEYSLSNEEYKNNLIPIINLGEINLRLGETEVALSYFRKGLKQLNNYDEYRKRLFWPELGREMSKSFKNLNQKDSAIYYAVKSYDYSSLYDIHDEIKESSKHLYVLYESYKLNDSALKYQNIYVKYLDSLFNNENIRNLQIATIQESLKQEKIQLEIIRLKEEREKNLILAAIGFFIPVFITVVFLISKWSKKKSKIITSLGIASLLMLFEFISLLIHPYVEKLTDHNIVLMYILLLIVASALVPLHHKMEYLVKKYFSNLEH